LDSKYYDKERFADKNNLFLLSVLLAIPIGYFIVNAIFIEPLYWYLSALLLICLFFMIFIYFHIKGRLKSRLHLPANILTNNDRLIDEKEVLNFVLKAYDSYQAKRMMKALPYIISVMVFVIMIIIFVIYFSSIFN